VIADAQDKEIVFETHEQLVEPEKLLSGENLG